ncbi:MAG: SAP domain-containing protein [Gallionella sp.]|nr:SAP domain-containing protein [Gallionella sp.]
MKLEEVRTIAKSHSIKHNHLSKTDLIKMIQTAEGNFDCFATAYDGECDQADCIWRDDCFETAQQEELS